MPKFWIRYSGIQNCENNEWEEIEVANAEEAGLWAWQAACDDYEQYAGLHGIPSTEDIEFDMQEAGEEISEEAVWDAYCDARESWLSYEVTDMEPENV